MKKSVLLTAVASLIFGAAIIANAQTYSNAVISLNPVGYWPLNETTAPPQPIDLVAQNLGSLGAAGQRLLRRVVSAIGNHLVPHQQHRPGAGGDLYQ